MIESSPILPLVSDSESEDEPKNRRDHISHNQVHHNTILPRQLRAFDWNSPFLSFYHHLFWYYENFQSWFIIHRRSVLLAQTTLLLSTQAFFISQVVKQHSVHQVASSISITLLFEFSKLCLSLFLFGFNVPENGIEINLNETLYFVIPSVIYIIADNLTFAILGMMKEPATFEILANIRVLTTSVIHSAVFQTVILPVQWAALLLLCVGTATSQLVTCGSHIISGVGVKAFFLILIHSLLSAMGGISVEYILKRRKNDSFYLQNVQMHAVGTILNFLVLYLFCWGQVQMEGILPLAFGNHGLLTALVVLNHTLCGLSISAIIKYCDAITRVYAHSMGMLLTMIMSSIIFWEMPTVQLVFGSIIVTISLYLFHTVEYELNEKKAHSSSKIK